MNYEMFKEQKIQKVLFSNAMCTIVTRFMHTTVVVNKVKKDIFINIIKILYN